MNFMNKYLLPNFNKSSYTQFIIISIYFYILNRFHGTYLAKHRTKYPVSLEGSPALLKSTSFSIKKKNPKYLNTEPKKEKESNYPSMRETMTSAEQYN